MTGGWGELRTGCRGVPAGAGACLGQGLPVAGTPRPIPPAVLAQTHPPTHSTPTPTPHPRQALPTSTWCPRPAACSPRTAGAPRTPWRPAARAPLLGCSPARAVPAAGAPSLLLIATTSPPPNPTQAGRRLVLPDPPPAYATFPTHCRLAVDFVLRAGALDEERQALYDAINARRPAGGGSSGGTASIIAVPLSAPACGAPAALAIAALAGAAAAAPPRVCRHRACLLSACPCPCARQARPRCGRRRPRPPSA